MMKGVKVKITMSFDVNMVVKEIKTYKAKKSAICDLLNLFSDHEARKAKKPERSRPIERTDTDKKRINILIGLIGVLVNSASKSSLLSNIGKIKKMVATRSRGI